MVSEEVRATEEPPAEEPYRLRGNWLELYQAQGHKHVTHEETFTWNESIAQAHGLQSAA